MSNITAESTNKKRGLGRGLGSLLGNTNSLEVSVSTATSVAPKAASLTVNPAPATETSPEARIWQVGIDKLVSSQFQPRQSFEKEKLEELAQSIKENGILQPIVARKLNTGKFEIIAGERRWRAAQLAGKHEVPVILKTLSNKETLELAIVENIQREDLNAIEEAEAYRRLIQEFQLTQQQVAEKVGKDRATVTNSLRLLALSIEARTLLIDGKISAGHAKVLLSIEDVTQQTKIANRIASEALSVRALEKIIQKMNEPKIFETDPGGVTKAEVGERLIQDLTSQLQKNLGTKVQIDYNQGKGKVSIYFYSNEELNQLSEKLKS